MRTGIASALAVSAMLAGCTKVAVTNTTPRAPTLGPPTYVIDTTCPTTIPPISAPPYEITLSNAFDIRKETVGKGGHAPGSHPGNHPPTALDWMTQVDKNQSGTIKITLTDPQLHFQKGGMALLGSTSDAPNLFCGLAFDTTNGPDPRWLSFTVHAGTAQSAGYDLGLMVDQNGGPTGGPPLPIIIDPWVDNDGVVARNFH